MASFVTPANGDDAIGEHVAQLTEDFSGLRNIPVSLTGINDASAYALTIKNAGTGSKGLVIYAADGTTVLLQADSNGMSASATGGAAAPIVTTTGVQTLTNKTLTTPTLTTPVINGAVTGTTFGAWTAFTPTVNQPTALTFTINNCRYLLVGKDFRLQMTLTVTQAGTTANDIVIANLPVSGFYASAAACVGNFQYRGATYRAGAAILATANTLKLQVDNNVGFLGTAPALALANGDTISIKASFETT